MCKLHLYISLFTVGKGCNQEPRLKQLGKTGVILGEFMGKLAGFPEAYHIRYDHELDEPGFV